MDALLRLARPEDRPLVAAKARRLTMRARAWAAPVHTQLGKAMYVRLSLAIAATLPHASDDDCLLLLRYNLWTALLDDQLDAAGTSTAGRRRVRRRVAAALAGRAGRDPSDFLRIALTGIVTDLAARAGRRNAALRRFRTALLDAVDGEIRQVRPSADHSRHPAFESDVDLGSHVNYRSYALALLIVAHPCDPTEILPTVEAALEPAARAVRLANDIRSVDRDRLVRRPDALTLLAGGDASAGARRVWYHINLLSAEHDDVLDRLAATQISRAAAVALKRSLRITLGLYRGTELDRGAGEDDLGYHARSGSSTEDPALPKSA